MGKKISIFVVHEWETVDGLHHVHTFKDEKARTQRFEKWLDALLFAMKKAKRLGLKEIQIDHPDLPHYFVKVK